MRTTVFCDRIKAAALAAALAGGGCLGVDLPPQSDDAGYSAPVEGSS